MLARQLGEYSLLLLLCCKSFIERRWLFQSLLRASRVQHKVRLGTSKQHIQVVLEEERFGQRELLSITYQSQMGIMEPSEFRMAAEHQFWRCRESCLHGQDETRFVVRSAWLWHWNWPKMAEADETLLERRWV
jgi:hypothetical protein